MSKTKIVVYSKKGHSNIKDFEYYFNFDEMTQTNNKENFIYKVRFLDNKLQFTDTRYSPPLWENYNSVDALHIKEAYDYWLIEQHLLGDKNE